PDLALTQIVVEVVTTTLFLLGLRWLPMRREELRERVTLRQRVRRGRDLVLAVAAGSGLAALSYALLTRPAPQSISPFFLDRPRQARVPPSGVVTAPARPDTADEVRGYMMVRGVRTRLLLPVVVLVAVHFFLRGHTQPGGGFVAGIVVAIGMLMQYIASGTY